MIIDTTKNPIYIHGKSGSGKTTLINNTFDKEIYDLHFVPIKNINKTYFNHDNDIINLFNKKKKRKVIVIDNIDVLNKQEKKNINDIIKMLKYHKKNKISLTFLLVFSGINSHDKIIKELISLCHEIKLESSFKHYNKNIKQHVSNIISGKDTSLSILDVEKATQCLLLHENIINNINKNNIKFYYKFITNFCDGDFYDRISFQKQLWIYNDITYQLKFIYNWYLYNNLNCNKKNDKCDFTKILTKYSTEYNNRLFIIYVTSVYKCTKEELYNICLSDNELTLLTPQEKKRLYIYFNIVK